MEKEEVKEEFKVKSYNTKELADHYGVTRMTFRKWLKPFKVDIGQRIGNYFSPGQVKIIVDHLGKPFIWLWSLLVNFNTWLNDNSQTQAAVAAMKAKALNQGHASAKGSADHHHADTGDQSGDAGGDSGDAGGSN